MDGPREYMSEMSAREELSHNTPYMWNLKRQDTHEHAYKTEAHRLRKQTYGCWREGIVWDLRKVMYKLLHLKGIAHKDLLCSTWNSAQCYVPA